MSMLMVASVAKVWHQYDGNRDGAMFPSRTTKLHRHNPDEYGVAACSSHVFLNDEEILMTDVPRNDICQRCIPRYVGINW